MQSLTSWFVNQSMGDPAVWLALSAGLVVILLFLFLGRRPSRRSRAPIVENQSPQIPTDIPSVSNSRNEDRRRSARRSGVPTSIMVLDSKAGRKTKPVDAFVLDRSNGGLRIALARPYPLGSSIQVRPSSSPESFEWVRVIVRSCREVGDYFEVGCQFETELEWSTLLMFG